MDVIEEAVPALVEYVVEQDQTGARALAHRVLADGVTAEQVLLDIVAPAQAQLGRMWQAAGLSAAEENGASCLCDRLVTMVADAAYVPPSGDRPVVIACAQGEMHTMPARLVAEVLRLRGHPVHFLGPDVPPSDLEHYLATRRSRALLLSVSLASRLPQAHRAVQAGQRAGLPVLVGGNAFDSAGRLADRLGANAWAGDARQAQRLLAAAAFPAESDVRPTLPDDGEYSALAARQWKLLDRVMSVLVVRSPQLRQYLRVSMNDVIAAAEHIIEHLTAAVYVDDDAVFTNFVEWLRGRLAGCHHPVEMVDVILEELTHALPDLPRARRTLATADRLLATTR